MTNLESSQGAWADPRGVPGPMGPSQGVPGAAYTGPGTAYTPARWHAIDAVSDTRDFGNADTLRLIDPDAPARGLLRAAADREAGRLLDADDRLALGVEPEAPAKGRVSWSAVLGVMFGLTGVFAALTGTLTPIGLAAGALGVFWSVAGLVATRRPYVASRPLAGLALLLSAAALVLTAMVYSGEFDWLNRDDQVGWLRSWLDVRVPGLERW